MSNITRVLTVDIGSISTKALLLTLENDIWNIKGTGEAFTTVERPHKNVMVGITKAVSEIEKMTGRQLLAEGQLKFSKTEDEGVDLLLATSSAGGGLQMAVAGVVHNMTAESAWKAALGAGAIVTEVVSAGNPLTLPHRVKQLQDSTPDIVLLAGGTEGGNTDQVAALAEAIGLAQIKPRFGEHKLPVVFAGNSEARDLVTKYIGDDVDLRFAENIRPALEEETIDTVNGVIHELFLTHVTQNAPGFGKLLETTKEAVLPTPSALGSLINDYAEATGTNVMAVDIGGSTTDVYTSISYVRREYKLAHEEMRSIEQSSGAQKLERKFHRSVSANLGVSISAASTLIEAGTENITRWLPFSGEAAELYDWCFNKMIRPTIMPTDSRALLIDHALAREALRLGFADHQAVAGRLHGVGIVRTMAEALNQTNFTEGTIAEKLRIDRVIGTGGVLTKAKKPEQALHILADGLQPEGITEFYLDKQGLLAQLGMISNTYQQDVFNLIQEGLAPLGTVIAPVGSLGFWEKTLATVEVEGEGLSESYTINPGQFMVIDTKGNKQVTVHVTPSKKCDVGAGAGKALTKEVIVGAGGLILDGRQRPFDSIGKEKLKEWFSVNKLYDKEGF